MTRRKSSYSREYVLTLPDDLATGEYTLVSGFYRRDTGQRLLSADRRRFALGGARAGGMSGVGLASSVFAETS